MRRRYAPNYYRSDRCERKFREVPRRTYGVEHPIEKKTSFVKCAGSTSSKSVGLDYKHEFSEILDILRSQINHPKVQRSTNKISEVVDCEKKEEEPRENEKGVESKNENEGVIKIELELEDEKEEEEKELKVGSEVNLNEKDNGDEEALKKSNIFLPIFANSILQVNENSIPKINHIGIPYNPGINHQCVDETNQQHYHLEISIMPKIDFVVPEETTDFQSHWKGFVCKEFIYCGLSYRDDMLGKMHPVGVIVLQLPRPSMSNAREKTGDLSSKIILGASPTCKGKPSRRTHFDHCEGDWVYIKGRHTRIQKQSKFHPRGDGPFHVIVMIGSKSYNLDVQALDSRSNPFEERGDDMIRVALRIMKYLTSVDEETRPIFERN